MKGELGFLLDLLFDHELEADTIAVIKARVKELEQAITAEPQPVQPARPTSITKIMAESVSVPAPQVTQVAHTPAAAAAMASREQAIAEAMSGKVNKDTGRPRKF